MKHIHPDTRDIQIAFEVYDGGKQVKITNRKTGQSVLYDEDGNLHTASLDITEEGKAVKEELGMSLGCLCAHLFRVAMSYKDAADRYKAELEKSS